jgi:hypothetical protein
METFYLIVLGIASLILILLLAFMGWTISNANKTTKYPKVTLSCPDNWTPDETTEGVCNAPGPGKYNNPTTTYTAQNTPGFISTTSVNFSNDKWSGSGLNPTCAKKKWASANKITWDSVTNAAFCS